MFPISILIATIAMASGIGGAVFFSPLFLLVLKLEPNVAIGTALLTELFGFSSGLVAYVRSKRIDYPLGINLLLFSIPGAVLGVFLADRLPGMVVKSVFAAGLIFLGFQIFASWRQEEKDRINGEILTDSGPHERRIVDRSGKVFEYSIRKKATGRLFAGIGGVFLGMISVGLAEFEEYELVSRCRIPSHIAVATSIFVVVITVFVAVIGHGYSFIAHANVDAIRQVSSIALFTIPGVLIGGQLGPLLGSKLDPDKLKVMIASIFMIVGLLLLGLFVR